LFIPSGKDFLARKRRNAEGLLIKDIQVVLFLGEKWRKKGGKRG